MRYFFDCEFIEDGKTIDLISIGMVAEDGREYYAVSTEFNEAKASNWVRENVLAHIPMQRASLRYMHTCGLTDPCSVFTELDKTTASANLYYPHRTRSTIAKDIVTFVGKDPEFWGYYSDYDWVVLCQLYGKMLDLPKSWPMYCRDIKQVVDSYGIKPPKQKDTEHHALNDARWTKKAYDFLKEKSVSLVPSF